jgi:hypothetical protein
MREQMSSTAFMLDIITTFVIVVNPSNNKNQYGDDHIHMGRTLRSVAARAFTILDNNQKPLIYQNLTKWHGPGCQLNRLVGCFSVAS